MKHLAKICSLLWLFLCTLMGSAQDLDYASTKEKVYLHTNHVFFTPGEDLFYKIYVVNAQDQQPALVSKRVFVEVISPAGSILEKQQYEVTDGYAEGSFRFTTDASGGIYKLRTYTAWMLNEKVHTQFTREITLLKVISPRVLMKLDFPRKGYGPGDEVVAEYSMKNLEQTPISNFITRYTVAIGGVERFSGTFKTDTAGKAHIVFRLPDNLDTNDALLNVAVDYKSNKEAISRSIPITLHKIDLQFMPEGGTLVEGIATNLAFKAVNEYSKPVDVKGIVLDDKGQQVAAFESLRFGMGVFRFTPQKGRHYVARLLSSTGTKNEYTLPLATKSGVVMNLTRKDSLLLVTLKTPQPLSVTLEGKTHNVTHFRQEITLQAGEQTVSVNAANFPAGIAVFTVTQKKAPLAERIVFLGQPRFLKIKVTPDKEMYERREKVLLQISTTNEAGTPVAANLSLAVVDDKKWILADDKQDNILSWLLLSSELHGKVEEPNFYFKEDEPTAPGALDLVMLTNGYRYFDYEEVVKQQNKLLYGPGQPHRLTGVIEDERGKPVPAKVYLFRRWAMEDAVRVVETDTAGLFSVLGLPPDSYYLFGVPIHRPHKGQKDTLRILENGIVNGRDGWHLRQPIPEKIIRGEVPVAEQGTPEPSSALGKNKQPGFFDDDKKLSEVVVVGYATVESKQAMTGSSVVVKGYELIQTPVSALSGAVAGVQVTRATPGTADHITIRGISTVSGNNEPLYIYNGLPVTAAELTGNVGAIQSITVLKDASAMALYGSRAANGVIVMTGPGLAWNGRSLKLTRNSPLPSAEATVNGEIPTVARRFAAPEYTARTTDERNDYRESVSPVRRFYTPKYTPKTERNDFRETVYWNPVIQTNKEGKATVSFYNSDATTSFRAITEGIGYNGQVGRHETTYASQAPVSVDAKIPPYLTTGDKVLLPVVVTNNRKVAASVTISIILPPGLKTTKADAQVLLVANGSQRVLFPVEATAPLEDKIVFSVFTSETHERILLPVTVSQKGFPANVLLSATAPERWRFPLKGVVPGSMHAKLSVYAEVEGLAMEVITGMLREPHGCFEQTSSTTYPNIFILKYLQQTGKINPAVKEKAMQYLMTGYNLLKSYETSAGGFEWFGHTPPQEVLTAYGLMEFTDMKDFIQVDEQMMARTKKFLLERRNGKGGFLLQASKSYQLRAVPYDVANTYIVYALTKAGLGQEITLEYETALKTALKSNSAWQLAVMANAAYYSQRLNDYQQLITVLKQGYETGTLGQSSVVGATGTSLNLETTAWYGLALAKDKNNLVALNRLMPQILKQRSYYGFGATQSTLLCLELLTAYSQMTAALKVNGKNTFMVNQSPVTPGILDNTLLKEGTNTFVATAADTVSATAPYDLELNYYALQPENSSAAALRLHTTLGSAQAKVGETVRVNIQAKNETDKGLPMSVAKIGIPAGLSAQPWQLKELIETGKITHYEVFDNYLVLYWLDTGPGETKTVNLDLKAEIPGTYKGRASNVYLYYMPEAKHWNAGLDIDIRD